MKKVISELIGNNSKTIYRWSKENRPIIKLLEMCFTKNELASFLKTGKKPYKIEFADKYFIGLYRDFSNYIVYNKGVKALFTAIQKNNFDDDIKDDNIDQAILNLYKNSMLNSFDVKAYFNKKPNYELFLYIKENKKFNWDIYRDSIRNSEHSWLMLYFEIIILSIEKNIYDIVFGQPNKNPSIERCLVPFPPDFFGTYANVYKIQEKYINILSSVKNAILSDTYKLLPEYHSLESSFDMNTEPL